MNPFIKDIASDLQRKWWFQHKKKSIMDNFLNLVADLCNIFPSPFKKIVFRTVDSIGLSLFKLVNLFVLFITPFYLLNCNQKDNNKNIRFLLRGQPHTFSSFINIVCNSVTRSDKVRSTLWKKNCETRQNEEKAPDVLLIKSDVFYKDYFQKKGFIIIPEYISFHLSLKNDVDLLISNISPDIKKDIARAEKTGYVYEIRRDENAFEVFYFQMYKPYMKWRHQESKKIASYATIRHLAGQGAEILFIKHNSHIIFGGMYIKNKNKIETHYAGLMKGKFNHLHNGVMALSYYYLIKIAKDYHCDLIDFGTASSSISDGLYQYKKKWNMEITLPSPFYSDIYAIKIINTNSSITEYIRKHPIHYLKGNKIEILSGLN